MSQILRREAKGYLGGNDVWINNSVLQKEVFDKIGKEHFLVEKPKVDCNGQIKYSLFRYQVMSSGSTFVNPTST